MFLAWSWIPALEIVFGQQIYVIGVLDTGFISNRDSEWLCILLAACDFPEQRV